MKQQPEQSTDQRIRNEFEAVGGGLTTSQFAAHCIDAGIWTDEEIDAGIHRWAQSEVRSALKKADIYGLPFAGKTIERDEETKAPIWKQRPFWGFADYVYNIQDLVSQRDVLHQEALLLQSECLSRFGKAPAIPDLDDGESESIA